MLPFMPRPVRRALVAAAAALPSLASADVVVMRTGSRISCTRAVEDTGRIRIELPSGGTLLVAPEAVKRIDVGAGSRSSGDVSVRASSGGDAMLAASRDTADRPMFDPNERRATAPVDAEVAYKRAVGAGRASPMPTAVGAMAGVEPVPTSDQLRERAATPPLDPKRQAWAERSRIGPGSVGGLMARPRGGAGSRGGWTGDGSREAPRVGR